MKKLLLVAVAILVAVILWVWRSKSLSHPENIPPVISQPSQSVQSSSYQPVSPAKTESLVSADVSQKVLVLKDVLKSHNDNDQRLDTDLKKLTPEHKKAFIDVYNSFPLEKRNERGIIVFLVGRSISSPEDVIFLRSVVSEGPCLSMSDCSKEIKSDEAHRDIGMDVSLAYPQLVALKQIELFLKKNGNNSPLTDELVETLRVAKNSKIPVVSKRASEVEGRY